MIAIPKPSTASSDPVTTRYSPDPDHQSPQDQNVQRIRLLMRLFGLTVTQIAKAGTMSRPYCSRLLINDLTASRRFWRELEKNLGQVVEERNCQFFWVPVADVEQETVKP